MRAELGKFWFTLFFLFFLFSYLVPEQTTLAIIESAVTQIKDLLHSQVSGGEKCEVSTFTSWQVLYL